MAFRPSTIDEDHRCTSRGRNRWFVDSILRVCTGGRQAGLYSLAAFMNRAARSISSASFGISGKPSQ
jgi:hypothetical protein